MNNTSAALTWKKEGQASMTVPTSSWLSPPSDRRYATCARAWAVQHEGVQS